VSQPWESIETKCMHCGRKMQTPAGRRRRAWRLNLPTTDFCSSTCNKAFVAAAGRKAQEAALRKTPPA